MNIRQVCDYARALLKEHGCEGWNVETCRTVRKAGLANFSRRTLYFSSRLMPLYDEDLARDVVIHEVAHVVVGAEHGHDDVWKNTCIEMGGSGETFLPKGAPKPAPKWVGVCSAGHVVHRYRRPTCEISCARCSSVYDPAHRFTWTQQY